MTKVRGRLVAGALLAVLGVADGMAEPPAQPAQPAPPAPIAAEQDASETIEVRAVAPPGATAAVEGEVLERDEADDIHKILGRVAGVYVRNEDGYGLRPNIGMRGAAAERSAKIALYEDNVLIAPAPYSAPAAYYFPLTTRMSRIEVIKGPSAIRFGPNTVGGAINLVSAPFPATRQAYLDLAGGSDRYGKLHVRLATGPARPRAPSSDAFDVSASDATPDASPTATRHGNQDGTSDANAADSAGNEPASRLRAMAEYVGLRSDGFKELDGGGLTGFVKHDASLTGQYRHHSVERGTQLVEARVGWAAEKSNETYTGLTDADFAAHPQRRYVATERDKMEWTHQRLRLAHTWWAPHGSRLETIAYGHGFDRAWGKVDGFVGNRDFAAILARPTAGAHPVYYALLTGQADSLAPEEELIFGTNDRSFVARGLQSEWTWRTTWAALGHATSDLQLGGRWHFDRAVRRRYEDALAMRAGALEATARPMALAVDNRAYTTSIAMFAQERLTWSRWAVTLGLRSESIAFGYRDLAAPLPDGATSSPTRRDDYLVWLPGGGINYMATDELELLAGVYRGFVPVSPSAGADILPERSINYEAGARWRPALGELDVIGFVSDYQNLKGTCTLSSGCSDSQDGDEFNGGAALLWGAEVQGAVELTARGFVFPASLAYTYTRSRFRTSFDSDFAGWGKVTAGDELPYLPEHQGVATLGLKRAGFRADLSARYQGAARDVAGSGEPEPSEKLAAVLTFDAAAHAPVHQAIEAYVSCTNLADEQVIIARRPYGARPNPPRMCMVGIKATY